MEDFLYKYLRIFLKLPLPVRKLAGLFYSAIPQRIKYGPFYYTYKKRLELFRNLDDNEINKAEHDLLFQQVNSAIDNIPFYKKYKKCESYESFRTLPIITKQIIMDSFEEFVNPNHINRRIKSNTGGSSGTPFEFYLQKDVSRPKEKAHFDWFWGQFNYEYHDRILMIRGLPLASNRLFEYRTIDNILNVSCYNANEKNIQMLAEEIQQFKPSFIHAYPSSLKILTILLEDQKFVLRLKLKAIFLGSEQVTDIDRQYFERFYQTPIVSWYGHTERLIHGGNCPYSNEYHFYPAYGHIELVDENNRPVEQPGMEGRIIATGFDNIIMPLIRYDTGDLGVLSEITRCKCGFAGTTLKRITGRSQNIIFLSDNTKVSLTAFIFGQHLEAFGRIAEMQIIQEKIGEIEIKMRKNPLFTVQDEKLLVSTLLSSVNNKLRIKISYADELPKTSAGKSRFFISKLS